MLDHMFFGCPFVVALLPHLKHKKQHQRVSARGRLQNRTGNNIDKNNKQFNITLAFTLATTIHFVTHAITFFATAYASTVPTESFTLESCVKARFLDSTRRRTGTLNTKCNTKNDTGKGKLVQHEPP